jgi:hypothetical protein
VPEAGSDVRSLASVAAASNSELVVVSGSEGRTMAKKRAAASQRTIASPIGPTNGLGGETSNDDQVKLIPIQSNASLKEAAAMKGNDGSDHDKLYFDMLSKVYAGIQEQIRFADTKAGFVAAFNAILVGFIASDLGTVKDIYRATHDWNVCLWLMTGSLIMGIPTAISIGYLIWAVRPRIGKNTHKSRIYFGHIARDYHLDGVRYRDDARAMEQGNWADDYGYQIVEVASIAQEKHSNVRTSMNWSFGAFVALVLISLAIHIISVFYLPANGQPTNHAVNQALPLKS